MPDTYKYANFWKRVSAISVDQIIIMCINAALFLLVTRPSALDPLDLFIQINFSAWTYLPQAIYYGIFLSSSAQSTPGKRMFSIYVISQDGGRLPFWKGALRGTLGYLISGTTMIGFLMPYFRQDKTALHDMIFKTYVLEGEPQDNFAKSLMSNSKYKEIYEKPVTEVKPQTTEKLSLEFLVAEEEAKLKAAQAKEKLKLKQAEPQSDPPVSEQKPVEVKPKKKPDDSW